MTTHQTTLDGRPIDYSVRRSSRASNGRIEVGVGGVTVILPAGVDVDPERFLRSNAEWVLARQAAYEDARARIPDRTFEEGEQFPYLGERRELVVEQRSHSTVTDESFLLARWEVERTSIKNALESLYRRLARDRFEARAEHFAAEMGVSFERIHVRNQRTRWGSCSTSGTISLNWRLVLAPPRILDYVVVHEVAHVIEPNHSDRFWAVVAEYDPEYETHRQWLDDHAVELIFDESDL